MFLMRPLAKVGQYGEGKYDLYNYLKGAEQLEYHDCMLRHLDKFYDPTEPDMDEESGESHLAHVAWNALVALYMMEHKGELDNRFKLEEEK